MVIAQKKLSKAWLTVWLLTPVVLVGALYFAFPKDGAHSLANRARTKQLAADLSTARIAAHRLGQGFIIRVHDLSGRAKAEGPVYLRTSRSDERQPMTASTGDWWEIIVTASPAGEPLAYSFSLGGLNLPALDESGHPEMAHSPPLVVESEYGGTEKRPVAEYTVKSWLEPALKPR